MLRMWLPIALTLALLIGCSKRVPSPESFESKGLKIGSVTVERQALAPEREIVFARLEAEEQIRSATIDALQKHNLYDPDSAFAMKIRVNDFRLRHGTMRFFLGQYTGSDYIKATVSVSGEDTVPLTRFLEASAGNENPFAISRRYRGTRLFSDIGHQAVAALQFDPLDPVEEEPPARGRFATGPNSEKPSCSVRQILALKRMGISDERVLAACEP